MQLLEKFGALIRDSHFVFTSRKHSSTYIDKDAITAHTIETSGLCRKIADLYAKRNIDVVIAPAIGGIALSQWTAYHLTGISGQEVLSVYAEKSKGGRSFVIRPTHAKLVSGKRVLVVEDTLSTGGSVAKVVKAVRNAGGFVVAVAALVNGGGVTAQDVGNVPELSALLDLRVDSWEESECPLCKDDIPINTDVGKGREFLARKQRGR